MTRKAQSAVSQLDTLEDALKAGRKEGKQLGNQLILWYPIFVAIGYGVWFFLFRESFENVGKGHWLVLFVVLVAMIIQVISAPHNHEQYYKNAYLDKNEVF